MLKRIFKHPQSVGMTYTSHMKHSLKISSIMMKGSAKAFVHAIFPDIFITSSTDINQTLKEMLNPSTKAIVIQTEKTKGNHGNPRK